MRSTMQMGKQPPQAKKVPNLEMGSIHSQSSLAPPQGHNTNDSDRSKRSGVSAKGKRKQKEQKSGYTTYAQTIRETEREREEVLYTTYKDKKVSLRQQILAAAIHNPNFCPPGEKPNGYFVKRPSMCNKTNDINVILDDKRKIDFTKLREFSKDFDQKMGGKMPIFDEPPLRYVGCDYNPENDEILMSDYKLTGKIPEEVTRMQQFMIDEKEFCKETPPEYRKWNALCWRIFEQDGTKEMLYSQELQAMRNMFLSNTPYSYVGKQQLHLLTLISNSDNKSHSRMAKEALAYYKEEIEKREQAAIEKAIYVPPPKKRELLPQDSENNYSDNKVPQSLLNRDLSDKYGQTHSIERVTQESTIDLKPNQIIVEDTNKRTDKQPAVSPKKLRSPKKLQEEQVIKVLQKQSDYDNLQADKTTPRKITATPELTNSQLKNQASEWRIRSFSTFTSTYNAQEQRRRMVRDMRAKNRESWMNQAPDQAPKTNVKLISNEDQRRSVHVERAQNLKDSLIAGTNKYADSIQNSSNIQPRRLSPRTLRTKNVSALRVAHQRGLYRNCSMDDNAVQDIHNNLYNPRAIIDMRQDYPKLYPSEPTDYTFTNHQTLEPDETLFANGKQFQTHATRTSSKLDIKKALNTLKESRNSSPRAATLPRAGQNDDDRQPTPDFDVQVSSITNRNASLANAQTGTATEKQITRRTSVQQELKDYNKISVDGKSKNSTAHDSGYMTVTHMGGFSCMNKSIRAGEINVGSDTKSISQLHRTKQRAIDSQSPSTLTCYRHQLQGQISNMKSSSNLYNRNHRQILQNRTTVKDQRMASDQLIDTHSNDKHLGIQSDQYEKENNERMRQIYEQMVDRQRQNYANKSPIRQRENQLTINTMATPTRFQTNEAEQLSMNQDSTCFDLKMNHQKFKTPQVRDFRDFNPKETTQKQLHSQKKMDKTRMMFNNFYSAIKNEHQSNFQY